MREINDLIDRYLLPLDNKAAHRLLFRFSYCALQKLYPDYAKRHLTFSIGDFEKLVPHFEEVGIYNFLPVDDDCPNSLLTLTNNVHTAVYMSSDADSIWERISILEDTLNLENTPPELILEIYQECLPRLSEE